MAKAFDRVNRDVLFLKLFHIGVSGNLLESLKCLYSECQATVNVNGSLTDFFDITSGVKQGDFISPTLFSLFINDLARGIKSLELGVSLQNDLKVGILLFADDIVLIAPSEEHLQLMINYVNTWCITNKWMSILGKQKLFTLEKQEGHDDPISLTI